MAEKAAPHQQSSEKPRQPAEKEATELSEEILLSSPHRILQQMQKDVGNRAVQRLLVSRSGPARPTATLHTVLQLLRSGSIPGNVRYDEGPEDEITIQIPAQMGTFEEVLDSVDRVIGNFDEFGQSFVNDVRFQDPLRAYLQSINHASVGGSPMSRERSVSIRVRLLRDRGNQVEGIEFVEPASPNAPAGRRPAEETAAEEAPAASAAARETGLSEEASIPVEERSLWTRFFHGVGEGAEIIARFQSARWLYERLNGAMDDFEREFVTIGENSERLHTEEQLAQPFLSASFTVLRLALGMLDLVAQAGGFGWNVASRCARLLAGEYSFSEYASDWWAVMRLHPGIALYEQFHSAYRRLREAYLEGNRGQFWLGMSELAAAAVMTYATIEGVARTPGRTGGTAESAVSGEAQAGAAAVPEAAATETAARPAGPAAETTARPAGPGAETTARPAGPPAETTASAAEAMRSGETGFSPEFQRWLREADVRAGASFEEARTEWVARMDQEMGAGEARVGRSPFDNPPHRVGEILPDAQARQMIEQWARGELDTPARRAYNHEQYVYEYREAGGWGRPPAGYIDSQGVFRFDRPENLGMPEIFRIRNQTEVESAISNRPPEQLASGDVLMEYYRRLLEERQAQPAARSVGEQQAGAQPAQPVDVHGATGEVVDVNAATGEQQAPGASPAAQAGEPASGQPAAAGSSHTLVNRAAQQHGVRRVFYPEEVAEAQRFLENVDRLNSPRMDLSPLGIHHRFARLVGMEADVIAYLTEDGFFIYNKEVLSSPHSRR